MSGGIDSSSVNRYLAQRQHLAGESGTTDIVQIARDIYGLHATNPTTPYASLFARATDFTRDQLERELYVKKTLGKIRCVRTTVHILPRETIPIAFAATRSLVEPNSEDFLRITGGVTRPQYDDTSREILRILAGEGMSTALIRKRLGTSLNVSTIINLMCDRGLLVRGRSEKGWKSNTHTYYLFSDYFPGMDLAAVDPAQARETTVRQYLAAYGPATVKDISWWSGFTLTEVRRILRLLGEEVTEVAIPELEGTYVMLAADRDALERCQPSPEPAVNLLPALDPYLQGYKERRRYLDQKDYDLAFDRSGNSTSTILVDGRVAGVWDLGDGPRPVVKLFLFRPPDGKVLRLLETRARAMGEFMLDRPVDLDMCDEMVPLPRRNAGGFMSPLAPSKGKKIGG
jgi:hypothetical protein